MKESTDISDKPIIDAQDLELARTLDLSDPMAKYRADFHIPLMNEREVIYFCGNSLGLQPANAKEYVMQELDDWAKFGVEGHFHAMHPWLSYHELLTDDMAAIVGAKPEEVVVMNSLTVNLHLLLVSFYRPLGKKRRIVVESDLFPSDLYTVTSQIRFHGGDPDTDLIMWTPRPEEHCPRHEDLEEIVATHKDEIALLFIGGVNYYTGQAFDLKRIVELGHANGIAVGFDLAHGAGNIDYSLHDSGADFAAWCSYKYLNSGPGGLSGVFVHERNAESYDLPRFAGWWGHNKETRFGMRDPFDPLRGAEGWQLSNPPILPMATLRASLEIFGDAGMPALRAKSTRLTGYLVELLDSLESDRIEIITPRDPRRRGCQVSILIKESGREVFDYISEHGAIVDWREPDVIRVAPVPLYNSFEDVARFVKLLEDGLDFGRVEG